MIKHVVVFDFTGITPEQEAGLTQAFQGMMGVIPELKSLAFGRNISPRDQSYTHCLVEEMDDMEAVQRYLDHPAHVAAVKAFVEPLSKTRAIVDYVF